MLRTHVLLVPHNHSTIINCIGGAETSNIMTKFGSRVLRFCDIKGKRLNANTETILTNNITRSSRIILSFKVSHRKPLRRRSKGNFHDIVEERSSPTSVPLPDGSKCHSSHLISSSPPTPYLTSSKPKHDLSSILLSSSLPSSSESCFFSFRGMSVLSSVL